MSEGRKEGRAGGMAAKKLEPHTEMWGILNNLILRNINFIKINLFLILCFYNLFLICIFRFSAFISFILML